MLSHLTTLVTLVPLAVAFSAALLLGLHSTPQGYGVEKGVAPGTASVIVSLRFPEDATQSERQAWVGRKVYLVGLSMLAHGPTGHAVEAQIDADFKIVADGLHQWIYKISLSGPRPWTGLDEGIGPLRLQRDQHFYPRRAEELEKTISIKRAVDLSGIVLQKSGAPAVGAEVVAVWGRRSIHGNTTPRMRTLTDEAGRFRFEQVPPDVDYVEASLAADLVGLVRGKDFKLVSKPASKTQRQATIRLVSTPPADEKPLAVKQPSPVDSSKLESAGQDPDVAVKGGWIDVTFFDEEGENLARSMVGLSVQAPSGRPSPRNGWPPIVDGARRYGPLSPGTYRVSRELTSVDRHGQIHIFRDVEVETGEITQVVLDERLQNFDTAAARCRGKVTVGGRPVLAAYLVVNDSLGRLGLARTKVTGEFEIAVERSGTYTMTVKHRSAKKPLTRSVQLVEGQTISLDFDLPEK